MISYSQEESHTGYVCVDVFYNARLMVMLTVDYSRKCLATLKSTKHTCSIFATAKECILVKVSLNMTSSNKQTHIYLDTTLAAIHTCK